LVLQAKGELDAAYEKTAELMRGGSESEPQLWILRARILNAQGNTANAVKHLQEASQLVLVLCPLVLDSLSDVHLSCAQVLRHDPDNTTAGRLLKAIRKLETLKSAGNDAFKAVSCCRYSLQCWVYDACLQGKWAEAAEAYTTCLALAAHPDAGLDGVEGPFAAKLYCNRAAAYLK
jgi:hypothetical protein